MFIDSVNGRHDVGRGILSTVKLLFDILILVTLTKEGGKNPMANESIKLYALKKQVPFWKIAEKLNIHESTFSRKLRHELTAEEKAQIRSFIDELAKKKEAK